jgi:hypothetical protein
MSNGIIIHTPNGSFRLTEELIDDYIYPINLRELIEKHKLMPRKPKSKKEKMK